MKAVIFGNGEINDYNAMNRYLQDADLIICCDGGVRHAYHMQILPSIIIGDFDSAQSKHLEYFKTEKVALKSYPSRKNESDMEICLDYAISEGAKEVIILGGIGSRFDHSLANIFLLQRGLEKNINLCIADENNFIQIIDKEIKIKAEIGNFVSILPITQEVTGVFTEGLEYPLRSETLYMNSSRGISNKFSASEATIKISTGIILIIQANDC